MTVPPAAGSMAAVEAKLVWYKVLTLVSSLGASSWGRFGAIYYVMRGLDATQIGIIELTMVLAVALLQPFWGFLADRVSTKKRVFLFTRVTSTAILLLLSTKLARGFAAILVISVAQAAFTSEGVIRAAVLELCGEHAPILFGRVRLYGAVGWGLGALVMGYAADVTGAFNVNFAIYALLMVVTVRVTALYIPDVPSRRAARSAADAAGSMGVCSGWRELRRALCRGPVIAFALEILVAGMGIGLVERMLFVYLQHDLLASTTLCGLSVFVTVIFEIPLLYFAGDFMERWGRNACLAVAYFCYLTRVWGYTLLTPATVWYILPLESLHGVTFAFAFSSFVETARQISPPGWEATVQALVNTVYARLGGGFGALAGGVVFDLCGARTAYRGAGVALACFCVLRSGLACRDRMRHRVKAKIAYMKVPADAPTADAEADLGDYHDAEVAAVEVSESV